MLSIPEVAQTDADKNDLCCPVLGERYTCRGQEIKVAGATVPQIFAERTGSVSPGLSADPAAVMAPSAHPDSSAAQLSGDSAEAEKSPLLDL